MFFHWRVEECDTSVVDTQDSLASLRSSRRSSDEHSCHIQRRRHRVIVVTVLFERSNLHSNQTFSRFLAFVVVQPLCADGLAPPASSEIWDRARRLATHCPNRIRSPACACLPVQAVGRSPASARWFPHHPHQLPSRYLILSVVRFRHFEC